MCVAIFCDTGKILDNDRLYRGWTTNNDGGGFAYLNDDKKVCIESGYLQYNDFQKAYVRAADRYSKNGPMLIHMRIRSTGAKGKDNCHPFKIKNGAMIHNGTMFFPTPPKDAAAAKIMKCDSRIFAETFYNILDREVLARAAAKILDVVGSYNKLVFLYDGGEHLIINEKDGYWDDDKTVWFSNASCRTTWRR